MPKRSSVEKEDRSEHHFKFKMQQGEEGREGGEQDGAGEKQSPTAWPCPGGELVSEVTSPLATSQSSPQQQM